MNHQATTEGCSPKSLGYYFPAEWEEHEQCWMAWPERPDVWPNRGLDAQKAIVTIIEVLSKYEKVSVLVSPTSLQNATVPLGKLDNVRIVESELDDIWLRDTGPTFILSAQQSIAGISWAFNGWGQKFPPWDKDALVAKKILNIEGIAAFNSSIVLEGGSFHSDGEGTLLVTESCLLNKNRNPHLSKEQIEIELCSFLGIQKVIWLPSGLLYDKDTDGHVDNFCCFCCPGKVLLSWCADKSDPQFDACEEALQLLRNSCDAKGRSIEIVKVPLPLLYYSKSEADAIVGDCRTEGEQLAASYLNFYIANGAVIMPGFGIPLDEVALGILHKAFPKHHVIQLQVGRQLALGGGNIHCITQQQPIRNSQC